jgi:hypothetical protein
MTSAQQGPSFSRGEKAALLTGAGISTASAVDDLVDLVRDIARDRQGKSWAPQRSQLRSLGPKAAVIALLGGALLHQKRRLAKEGPLTKQAAATLALDGLLRAKKG